MEINAYNSSSSVSSTTTSAATKKDGSTLDMDDFLNLLVTQLSNQDALNPMDNTEFISQLAQFSSLQAMSDMAEATGQNQATSLIGKTVVMSSYDNKGNQVTTEGVVEKVTIYSGKVNLYVDGQAFELSNVMEIKAGSSSDTIKENLVDILDETSNINPTEAETEVLETN